MTKSTFDELMENPRTKKMVNDEYQELLLKELFLAMSEGDTLSVRKLAKAVGLSPKVIQGIRTGKQKNIRLSNFINITHSLGYHIDLVKGRKTVHLEEFVAV